MIERAGRGCWRYLPTDAEVDWAKDEMAKAHERQATANRLWTEFTWIGNIGELAWDALLEQLEVPYEWFDREGEQEGPDFSVYEYELGTFVGKSFGAAKLDDGIVAVPVQRWSKPLDEMAFVVVEHVQVNPAAMILGATSKRRYGKLSRYYPEGLKREGNPCHALPRGHLDRPEAWLARLRYQRRGRAAA